ncbi:MAG: signal peptidase II [Thermoguttaceae bacterium]|nr:signal peptidase II [Thermoguttaceae bacterium]
MKAVPLSRYLLYFSLAILGGLLDLTTKHLVFDWLGMPGERPVWWLIDGVVGFQTSLNEGALFGLGQGMAIIFSLLSIAAAAAILVWLFGCGAARDRLLTTALGLISAGILGNLYDRLGMHRLVWNYANRLHEVGEPVHAVRDWILVMIGSWPWPTFNLADSMLVCGAALLVWHAFRSEQADPSSSAAAPTVGETAAGKP